ncbi:TipAS antibiotic-recognition domain-containing protein [Lysobacter sp. Root494]|uniref:TipAS antibiotic-recognition domain-containing protein n=1 Tax=Lysobacter sp. Root494 TaxID=1736549 RepID=UPI0006FD8AAC|nr:TipAS antibiotic-recognition domain-containing protein [Lysobacter sp. Root494]KQY51271.1 hypothetical protein ASD14_10810 [Lysobacter sp. Root494]
MEGITPPRRRAGGFHQRPAGRARRDAGYPADSAVAAELAERHRLHIDGRFYPRSHAMQCGLADIYEAVARFRDYYDRHREGLTGYLVRRFVRTRLRATGARENR